MIESEFILLRQFASNGDAESFAQIIKEHAPMVYGVCLRILHDKDKAADAVQDTFFQLVRDAAEITGSLANWLHRVATYRSIDLIRNDSQRKQRESKYIDNYRNDISQNDKAAWQEISCFIDEELNKLDELTREVIIMHFFEGQTMTCIGEKFGISQQTVSRRIDSGVVSLRHNLKSRGVIVSAAILTTLLTENIVQAVPATIMKELGKIALAGSQASSGTQITTRLSAAKTKIIAFTIATLIIISSIFVYLNYTKSAENENITAEEIIRRYVRAVNSWDKSVAMRVESVIAQTRKEYDPDMLLNWTYDFQYRRDGNKCEWFGSVLYSDNENEASSWETQFRAILGNDLFLSYSKRDFDEETKASMDSNVKGTLYDLLQQDSYSNFLEGWVNRGGDATCKIAELMKECKSDDLKLIGKEMISDTSCFIVEAKTIYGTYTAWIAPEKGYNALKYTLSKSGQDILRDDIRIDDQGITLWEETVDSIVVKKIDGIFIPVSGQLFSRSDDVEDGGTITHIQAKRSEIVLNPDFNTLDAFKIDLPKGTKVKHSDVPGIEFLWEDGKFVPDINDYIYKNLTGILVPSLKSIINDPEFDYNEGKMILLCFWDMQQRSSRNLVTELSKQEQNLRDKSIDVFLVHTSDITDNQLQKWIVENNVPFTCRCISGDYEKIKYHWGLRALPWLILTDKNHIVTDEGFSITELDEKI